ncbi:hypothetical protein [Blastococcus capsensis]|uniref:hypothetical protein n=1 Tax=Blastococcus capsensis TaxID=1564163 RepID=UPI0025423762|nr:hypothetical protein [Blastococcus capsensis]MDK3258572.1 hypothetical protein [Blastococcus capsensis]
MTDRETSVLLDELAGRVPVGPPPTAQLLRAGRRARRRRAAGATLAVAAGVAVVVGGIVTVVDPAPDGAAPAPMVVAEEPGAGPPATPEAGQEAESAAGSAMSQLPQDPTAGRTGPLADGGAASCVAEYSPAAVEERDFAFAGVVIEIGPTVTDRSGEPGPDLVGVTFTVQEWFSGGEGTTVTVDVPAPAGSSAGSGRGPVYGVGSRLLVSGEDRWGEGALADPIAWMCGFTRYYDKATAASWR